MSVIERVENRISVEGHFVDARRLLATIHSCTDKFCYPDLELDFSLCTKTFPETMLALCAQVMAYREANVYISLVLPAEKIQANYFKNTLTGHT